MSDQSMTQFPRVDTCDSGFFRGSDDNNSEASRPVSVENLNMKDLLLINNLMSNNEMVEEEPVRNGIKNIELKGLSMLDFNKKPAGSETSSVSGDGNKPFQEKLLLPGDDSESSSVSSVQHVQMKKRVGLLSGVALIVGTMIGSGIFISPKGVLASTGSIGVSLMVWSACGFISLLGALSYAELGTMITKSGAEYAYLREAFSGLHSTLGPIPAFLYAWTSVLILKPALFGVVSMSFALYTVEPFYGPCGPTDMIVKLVAVLCLFVVTFINAYSVSLATKVQNFFTVTKLVAVAIIVVGGACMIYQGETEYLQPEQSFEGTSNSASIIALAFYDGLWAYDGWNNLNYVTEEIKHPYKNLPRAIMLGIPLVTICYILINISYFTVLSKQELLLSTAVASTWGDRVLGWAAGIIPVAVAFSAFGAANGSCFTGSRVMYVAARDGNLPEVFSYVHVGQYTPLPSLLISTLIATTMVLMGEIFQLIDFFSFTAWFFYGLTMFSLIVLRLTQKDRLRPYKVPLVVPIFVLLCSIYLVVAPIIYDPRIEFFYAFLFTFSGLFFYIPFVVYGKRIACMKNVTFFIQMLLWVAPSKYVPAE